MREAQGCRHGDGRHALAHRLVPSRPVQSSPAILMPAETCAQSDRHGGDRGVMEPGSLGARPWAGSVPVGAEIASAGDDDGDGAGEANSDATPKKGVEKDQLPKTGISRPRTAGAAGAGTAGGAQGSLEHMSHDSAGIAQIGRLPRHGFPNGKISENGERVR